MALRAGLREQGWYGDQGTREPNLAELLDLVALGTIADLVPLDYNNRILVSQGVARIRAGRCCPGIKALFKAARRTLATLTSQDLGFIIAPRLNAAGRLTDMSLGIECLLADDTQHATEFARRLEQLNQERKKIQHEMQTQALDTLNLQDFSNNDLPSGYCMFDESWHQGVIGIIASRIKDEIHRPVIAFARDDDKFLKGSARSVAGIHIRDVLDTVAARHPGMIVKFGGHAMAAGLTIPDSMLDDFRSAFHQVLNEMYSMEDLKNCIMTDGELNGSELSMEVARILIEAGPWGQGFPEPLFDGEFKLVESRIVGEKHLKLQLNHGNKIIDAIAFNRTDDNWPHETQRLHTVYRLDINEFAGRRRLQLIIEDLHPLP